MGFLDLFKRRPQLEVVQEEGSKESSKIRKRHVNDIRRHVNVSKRHVADISHVDMSSVYSKLSEISSLLHSHDVFSRDVNHKLLVNLAQYIRGNFHSLPKSEQKSIMKEVSLLDNDVKIIDLLAEKPMNVNDMSTTLKLSRQCISERVNYLKNAGMLISQKSGQKVFYSKVER